ncbi:hypothetical protein [Thaumasiovibrio subtropicus]|uniref:hypothetical protein n=1 Tax=Thaumasiovibrio subtropicus TaxID=1891207 RepID=UPI00131C274F|nr:hypothetical protein [Thaumasiovibrio subtropicus]
MKSKERIADLEQQVYLAFADGNYEMVDALETEIEKLRQSRSAVFDSNHNEGPYSTEGYMPMDDY